MKPGCCLAFFALPALLAADAPAQSDPNAPNLGYLYPAGGRQGGAVKVLAGGQRLHRVDGAIITGKDVEVPVGKSYRPVRNLNGDQRQLLVRMLKERAGILAANGKKPHAAKNEKPARPRPKATAKSKPGAANDDKNKTENKEEEPVTLPAHPLLENIERMNLRQLEVVRRTFLRRNRNQLNPQIAELVSLEVRIAPHAQPGDRSIRLVTPKGLSNPVRFQIGALPERLEQEPNEPRPDPKLPPLEPLALPVVVNGQILPGDVDRIPFRARKGDPVVVEARARRLIPYLADAVPGWFQIVVTLYDEHGNEVAYADDFRFDPDPVLRYEIPANGVYQLEVRDAIYRGRRDFVYRIRLGNVPVVTEMFPLGTRQGLISKGRVRGWNLPAATVDFNPGGSGGPIRTTTLATRKGCCRPVSYAVDPLPRVFDREPNNDPPKPQSVNPGTVVDGRIDNPGDRDVFHFRGQAGQKVVAEVLARRLNSPLDSKLQLLDARGRVLAWNDDHMEKHGHLHLGPGLLTHHADSYLQATLPSNGPYFLVLADAQNHGGSAYAYRLRLSAPRPGFLASVSPSSLLVPAGGHAPLHFHISRTDGFNGPVEFELLDPPHGYRLHGARIPPGCSRVRATLEALHKKQTKPLELRFKARGVTGHRTIETTVQPADNRMQAFLWRHLVPAEQFLVMLRSRGRPPRLALKSGQRLRLARGTTASARIVAEEGKLPDSLLLELNDPPPGLSIRSFDKLPDELSIMIEAESSAETGMAGNLIVEAWVQPPHIAGRKPRRPWLAGILPPIPFIVTQP